MSVFRVARVCIAPVLVGVFFLAGCSGTGVHTAPPTSEESAPAPEAAPELIPGGTAADNLPFFTATLRSFGATTEPVQAEPIVNALVNAGFEKTSMQVSFNESKTGLPADNIFVSVRYADSCLIGQVVASDRSVATEEAGAVGPEKNLCLIGDTRQIDW